MADRFTGKVVIITGAASGIGREVAFQFGREGAAVVLADSDRATGEASLQDAIATGARAIFVEANVALEADAARISDQAVTAFGGVDILVNSAGIAYAGSALETSAADWERVIAANLGGTFFCSRAVLPQLIRRGGGSIVNVASVAGHRSPRRSVAYSASKAGVIALTRAMAVDHASDKVRVNCVAPGMTDTPMLRRAAEAVNPGDYSGAVEAWAGSVPAGRPGTAAEVATAVLFLASDGASFITGSILDVDGGTMASLL